jgi:hypothetical protein
MGARSDSRLIRVIRVQELWAILSADCSWPESDRSAVPKLPEQPKFGLVPPCTRDRLLVMGAFETFDSCTSPAITIFDTTH